MGQLQKYAGDMNTLSASGINNMALSLFGSDSDRAGVRSSLLGRGDLKSEDQAKINATTVGSQEEKDILAKLSRSMSKNFRQGHRGFQSLAGQHQNVLGRYGNRPHHDMRTALVYLAGDKDGKTISKMQTEMQKSAAKFDYDNEMKRICTSREDLTKQTRDLQGRARRGEISPLDFATGTRNLKTQRDQLDENAIAAKRRPDDTNANIDNLRNAGARG